MSVIDWLLVILPLFIITYVGIRMRRYVCDLSDFLVGGRTAGRYVLAVSNGQAMYGLISLVAMFEMFYQSGFAIGFWNTISVPIWMLAALTGFISYRFRETRAMTLSQFFEMRYSRKFRFFTGVLQAVSGVVNYGLFPAVGARFLIYYTNLPVSFEFAGITISTYAILMFLFLGIALLIATIGGQVAIIVTNSIQGILTYPMFLIIILTIICTFSWWDQISPVLIDRPEGQSFLNPFDNYKLRDFNLFYVFVGIFMTIYNLKSWSGTQAYNASGFSPHEQKMSNILSTWSSYFVVLMYLLIAMAAFTYMNNSDFKAQSTSTERKLQWKTLDDIAPEQKYSSVKATDNLIEERKNQLDEKQKLIFKTISSQMRVPVAIRDILPIGVTGIFCAVMIFLMTSTDASYIHSWGSIIVQDMILPFQKKQLSTGRHLLYLRLAFCGVAIYAFVFSLFFGQVTYILMFFALTGSIWLGGAGVVIIGGLYWKRGTAAGAWASMIVGGILAVIGFICTQYWANLIYPALAKNPDVLSNVSKVVEAISQPFEPIILWRVTPEKFPMNGQEVLFLTTLSSILVYVTASLITCKEPFDMDKMLHRTPRDRKDKKTKEILAEKRMSFAQKFTKSFIGIDSQYTKGDRAMAWSVFIFSFIYSFVILFLIPLLWNLFIFRWPDMWWSTYYFIIYIVVALLIGVVSCFWFFIGTTVDLKKMFRRLASRQRNEKDDGRVIGHLNADDVEVAESVEDNENK